MPFTGSHPAAVLPLLRTGLPASALVIGSLAPDLPYFLPLPIGGRNLAWVLGAPSHTAWGVLTLDVGLGALAWVLWQSVLVAPLIALAPGPLRERLDARAARGRVELGAAGPSSWAAVVSAVALGAATHVGWDEFTHPGRWGTAHLPVLRATWAGVPGHVWAQHLSSLAGGLLCAVAVLRWWRRTPRRAGPVPSGDVAAVAATLAWSAGVAACLGVGAACAAGIADPQAAAFMVVTRATSAGLAAVVTVSLLWHAWHGLARRST